MLLKRNLLTILYSVLFVLVFGIGFLEVAQLAISETTNRNIIACILVLAIAIYLIVAFFIKEGRYLEFFQAGSVFSNLLEGFFLLFVCGTMFFLTMERGTDNALLIVIMLVSIYACARLLGGRLCGSFALVAGFFFILSLANASFDSEEYINCLCFLVPYAAFLWITQNIVKNCAKRGFILFCSYLFLAILFALAVAMNPFVCALLIGCVCALIFGASKEEGASKLTKGPIAAIILVIFTAGLLVGCKYLLVDLSLFPAFDIDSRILANTNMEQLLEYCLSKYTRAMQYIYRPFTISFFPAVMMFLGCVSGYYAIRKKASGIGPLCLTYIILLVYYMFCNELGTHFYYLTFFLPVFTAYGISCTLISDEVPQTEDSIPAQIREQNEQNFIPEAEPVIQENLVTESEEAEKAQQERKEKEKNVLEESMKKQIQEDISLNAEKGEVWESEEIPEWTISPDYISKMEQEENELMEEKSVSEEVGENNETAEEEISLVAPESAVMLKSKTYEEEPEATVELSVEDNGTVNAIQVEELGSEALNTDMDYKIASPEILETEQVDERKSESYMQDLNNLSEEDIWENNLDSMVHTHSEEDDAQLDNLLERLDISENIRRMQESATEDLADVIEREEEREELLTAIPADEMNYEAENLVYEFDLDEAQQQEESPELLDREDNLDTDKEKDGFHSLPKYVKPDFDFSMEPISQSLPNSESVISEYDRVPTINDLERKWRELNDTNDVEDEEPIIDTPTEEITEENPEEQLVMDSLMEEPEDISPEPESGFAYSLEDVSKTLEEAETPLRETETVIHSEEIVKRTAAGKRSYHRITLG